MGKIEGTDLGDRPRKRWGSDAGLPLDKISIVYYNYIVYDIINICYGMDNESTADHIPLETDF